MGPYITTAFAGKGRDEPLLEGSEDFPVIGDLLPPDMVKRIVGSLAGLTRRWDCDRKALRVADALPGSIPVLGSCYALSADGSSSYGYEFRPPYEYHAWVMHRLPSGRVGLLDFGLPGMIETGLSARDAVGPFLVGREPVILNGEPPYWMKYVPFQRLTPNLLALAH